MARNAITARALPSFLLLLSLLAVLPPTILALPEIPSSDGGKDSPPPTTDPTDPPCTITSPSTGSFFDLRGLIRQPSDKDPSITDFISNGYDYEANFTTNICGPVIADTSHAKGIDDKLKPNISAFYTRGDDLYSIGMSSSELKFRGRKLVLEYTDGSPCPANNGLRKSTVMSLLCDREFITKPSVSFVGQANDCAYFFEVRTNYACPTFKKQESVGPISIFAIIGLVFAVVYLVGGCVYQRAVMHARGWKQIPHYHTWVNIFTLFSDLLSFLLAAATRLFPCLRRSSTRGRSEAGSSSRGGTSNMRNGFGSAGAFQRRRAGLFGSDAAFGGSDGRFDADDENRILDQLDEEWADE